MTSLRAESSSALGKGGQTVAAIVGMAFFWKFFRSSTSVQLLVQGFSQLCGSSFDAWVVATYIVGFAVACLVVADGRISQGIDGPRRALVLGALATLSLFLPAAMGQDWLVAVPLLGFGLLVGCLLVYAISLVVLACAWSAKLRSVGGPDGSRTPLFIVAISLLIDLILSLVELVVPSVGRALCVLAPLVSAGAYAFVARRPVAARTGSPSCAEGDATAAEAPAPGALRFGLIFVFSLAIVTKELAGVLLSVDEPDNFLLAKNIITLMELVLVVSICLVTESLSAYLKYGWLILAGLFLAETLVAAVGSPSVMQMAYTALFTVPVCFEMFAFQLVVANGSGRGSAPARMACLFIVIPEMGAHALGHGVIALLGPSAGLQLAQNAQLLACILGVIAVVGLFAVVCTLAFRKPGQGWSRSSQDVCADPAAQTCANPAPDVAPEERREDPESLLTQAVSHLAAEHGLTPRETDMVGFICRGYTNKRISQLCCVSVNTVQTHIQNCYRKLGVHNRQELIDLLEGQQEGR